MALALAIFAFNRPGSLSRLLDSLNGCPEFPDAEVTIFVDGSRNEAEADLVRQTIAIAHASARPGWTIVASPHNKGLRRSIYDGVSDVCARFGHAIVLEDDLVVAPVALTYFSAALDKYESDPRVWSICGYTYEAPALTRENRAFFLPFAHPWGWATWERAWKRFEFDGPIVDATVRRSQTFSQAFDLGGLIGATDLLDLSSKGLVDSWYIRWYQTIFLEGGLSLFPSRRLISNLGISGGGTHSGKLNPYSFFLRPSMPTCSDVPAFPASIHADYEALDTVRRSYDARILRVIAKIGKWKRLARQLR